MKLMIKKMLRESFSKHVNDEQHLPNSNWLKSQLRNSIWTRLNGKQLQKIRAFYIVGSEARGMAKTNSDIDIAVIMEPINGINSLKFTERFHDKYKNDTNKPTWNGRLIDFQFFWLTDEEWQKYDKIPLN